MAAVWREDDEEFKLGAMKEGYRSKPRFSYNEVKMLLDAVTRNRYILLKKFNQGVSAETKKQTWTEITNQINSLGENHRQVRQIMKKWADLKCDGKRRIVAMRGPNGSNLRKKKLGPVEKMVHKILMMSPKGDGESDPDLDEAEFSKRFRKGPTPTAAPYSYLSLTDSPHPAGGDFSFDMSPLSSPEKELGEPLHSSSDFDMADDGEHNLDFDETDDSVFSSFASPPAPPSSSPLEPLPDDARLRARPLHTYSRTSQAPPRPPTSSSIFPPDGGAAASSSGAPPPSPPPANGAPSRPAPPRSAGTPPPRSEPASSRRLSQLAAQSVQQQRASGVLLGSVSRSLEALAQSLQLLVESQQEFVQESLQLQRQTVDVLRDFSSTALAMLRDKAAAGGAHPHPPHHHHPPSARF